MKLEIIFNEPKEGRPDVVAFEVDFYTLDEGALVVTFQDELVYIYPLHTISRIKVIQ